MGKKKKIRRIVEAVGHLFATPPNRKKLRKARAFEGFLEQLRERQAELIIARDEAEGEHLVEVVERLDELDRQIAKAERLLEELQEG